MTRLGNVAALLTLALLIAVTCAQAQKPLQGVVVTSSGRPVAGVLIYGGRGDTIPVTRENVTTDANGRFLMRQPGRVIHFRKDGFQPRAVAVPSSRETLRITLAPARNDLLVPQCAPLTGRNERIGSGNYGLRFVVDLNRFELSRGTTDVDYVRHVVAPRGRKSFVALWLGPHAFSPQPADDRIIASIELSQRDVRSQTDGLRGLDSSGRTAKGTRWRELAVFGEGGAEYDNAMAEDALLLNEVINSACFVPYPKT